MIGQLGKENTQGNLIHENKHWGVGGTYEGGTMMPSDALRSGAQRLDKRYGVQTETQKILIKLFGLLFFLM